MSFYITTPIYYVNDQPHIGHAYTTLLADVLARYHRMRGTPTHFLTGTDEHGQKVARAAGEQGVSPREQADRTVVRFLELWRKLEITFDDFIRTTETRHESVVRGILTDLHERGEIYRDEYDGWYCTPCERFFTEKDLLAGNCPECGRQVERIREANYFFRMSRYQQWLLDYIEKHPGFIQPDFRRNETLGFLRQPLNDLCISRPKSRLEWGIELPFDSDYVTYVWFDALVNYISAVGYRRDDEQFRRWWPPAYHLIGKDILTTHTVYWPTMLKAMGLPMPRTVFAHGWWLMGESKMSKSAGNVVDPIEMADRYGVDPFRYFLIAEMTLGQDANFTEEQFIRRFNTDLANDLGNLVSRVAKMIGSYCKGIIPAADERLVKRPEEQALWSDVQQAVTRMNGSIDEMRLDLGLAAVMNGVRSANRYLELRQPWALAGKGETADVNTALYTAAESLRVLAALLFPVMPGKMDSLRQALGMPPGVPDFEDQECWGVVRPGTPLGNPGVLFPRINTGRRKTADKSAPRQAKRKDPAMIDIDTFGKMELKTATVVAAEAVEGTDKLLKLQVDLGGEHRQLVAGIALHYRPEDLVGRTVVVVCNLEPARIRGVESNGMLLAASAGDKLQLLTVDGDIGAGASVR